MKKLILGTLTVIAFIFLVCSIGAYDNGNITLFRLLIQVGISVFVEWRSLKALNE